MEQPQLTFLKNKLIYFLIIPQLFLGFIIFRLVEWKKEDEIAGFMVDLLYSKDIHISRFTNRWNDDLFKTIPILMLTDFILVAFVQIIILLIFRNKSYYKILWISFIVLILTNIIVFAIYK